VTQTFGERLRSLRTRRRLTPSALAHAVGVTEGAIRQMESGQTKSASFLVGLKLSRELGVTPWFLATGENAPRSETESRSQADPVLAVLESLTQQVNALDRRVKALEAPPRGGRKRKAPG
jgi:transcriptional regulator with XRE-family HTH domain